MTAEYDDALRLLSRPAPTDERALTRRRFLQLAAGGVGAAALLPWWADAAAAAFAPLGASDGVLVIVNMKGGNDGLNTVCPTGTGRYYDRRPTLAIPGEQALSLGAGTGLGFHPALTALHQRFGRGKVAVVRGVGYPKPDLSHFESVAHWMRGWGGTGRPMTGWLGRWMDGLPHAGDHVHAITVGSSLPLHLVGEHTEAASVPLDMKHAFGAARTDPSDVRMLDTVRAFGGAATGLGEWGDAVATCTRETVDLVGATSGYYAPALPSGRLARQLVLCARLINANLGLRVLNVSYGDFDHHADQPGNHAARMAELDAGLQQFFDALDDAYAGRVTVMTASEFGRRPEQNSSNGTDHGSASVVMLAGDAVKGGLYGADPSLSTLDGNGNLVHTVDFRSLYATILDRWLAADSQALLGASYEHLDVFDRAPDSGAVAPVPVRRSTPPARASRTTTTSASTAPPGYWLLAGSGNVGNFGERANVGDAPFVAGAVAMAATPSRRGYWVAGADGTVRAFGDAVHHGDVAGTALRRPVVSMAATPTGKGYWLLAGDGGVFAFGDAAFHGSTGNLTLNQPVVGMAAARTGRGYWFVSADGGVFAFGPDAHFHGSTGGIELNRPVVAMAATPTGEGYWLVASDGGVFAFGDAAFHGSTGALSLRAPIVGIAPTPTGRGYWFVASDGAVFAFGDARFEGGLAGQLRNDRITAIAA